MKITLFVREKGEFSGYIGHLLEVNPSDTVGFTARKLPKRILDLFHIRTVANFNNLGKSLEFDCTLDDLGVQDGDNLLAVLRMRQGHITLVEEESSDNDDSGGYVDQRPSVSDTHDEHSYAGASTGAGSFDGLPASEYDSRPGEDLAEVEISPVSTTADPNNTEARVAVPLSADPSGNSDMSGDNEELGTKEAKTESDSPSIAQLPPPLSGLENVPTLVMYIAWWRFIAWLNNKTIQASLTFRVCLLILGLAALPALCCVASGMLQRWSSATLVSTTATPADPGHFLVISNNTVSINAEVYIDILLFFSRKVINSMFLDGDNNSVGQLGL